MSDVYHFKAIKKVEHAKHFRLWHEKVHDSAFLNTGMKPVAAFFAIERSGPKIVTPINKSHHILLKKYVLTLPGLLSLTFPALMNF